MRYSEEPDSSREYPALRRTSEAASEFDENGTRCPFQHRIAVMDLFQESRQKNLDRVAPLAARMRPRTLDEFVGQEHFLGEGKLLRRMLEADRLTSVIFYGPPGTGKTTLAQLIAIYTKSEFVEVNAAAVGVKE